MTGTDQGAHLRALREQAGLTLADLAGDIGYSISHMSNVERGVKNASEELIRRYENLAVTDIPVRESTRSRHIQAAPAADTEDRERDDFATRLMRLRIARGWSLSTLAVKANISKSYIGKLELGRANPSSEIAKACDRAFGTDGDLARLAAAAPKHSQGLRPPEPPSPGEQAPPKPDARAIPDPEFLLQTAPLDLAHLRRVAQRDSPWTVFPELSRQARTLASAASATGGATGRELWLHAARFAEFTGWMAQEAGYDGTAERWTSVSACWAQAGGDRDMASYQWERRALIALYRCDARETIALARRASSERAATPRVLGLAARREAQGHALSGDRIACCRALRRASELIARGPAPFPFGTSWGPNSIDDSSAFIEASCLVDLGLHRQAVKLFATDPTPVLPPSVVRTRARFIAREALALAGAGELDQACELAAGLVPAVSRVDSATLRADVRRLADVLSRRRGHRQAQALLPALRSTARPVTGNRGG